MPRQAKLRTKNNQWYTGAGGGRYFGSTKTVPRADAELCFREYLLSLLTGPPESPAADEPLHDPADLRVVDVFNAYLNYLQRDRAADYHADRTGRLRRFCEFAVERDGRRKKIGKLPALSVRIEDLIAYQEHLRTDGRVRKASKSQQSAKSAGKGLQPRTVKGYVKAVLTAFNWASESNEGPLPLDFMPFRGFRHVRVPLLVPTEDSLITDDEHRRLL